MQPEDEGRLAGIVGPSWRQHLSTVFRRRWVAVALVSLLALLALFLWRGVSQPADRFWARIQETGYWRVGLDPSFPPFEALDDSGQPMGFDVDLAAAIAGRWGVEVQVEGVGFDGLIDAVWASRIDSAISALPIQPQFSEDVAFSQPYFEAGLVLVTGTTSDQAPSSVEELGGKRVAVEWGSEGDLQARSLRRRLPDLEILPMETPQSALAALRAGSADAALVDRVSALQYAGQGNPLRIHPTPVVSDPYVIVMPRKAPLLQQKVGEALSALQADGTLDALTEKWFGASQ